MPSGVQRDAAADNPPPGCCDTFLELLRACGLICYVACPPVPSVITRKLAFHPPEKGATYRLALKSDPEKAVKDMGRCKDDDYQLVVRNLINGGEHVHPERDVEVFSVTTVQRNELVVVRCRPEVYSNCSAVSDQVILFCQPNSSDLGGFLQPTSMNFTTYANVFETDFYAFDYSGYGYSSGRQGEKNMYADVRAVFQKIREMQPDKKIIVMGYSIGTTAAVDLAATNPEGLSGVVLIAPFTSGLRLFSRKPDKPNTCWADSFTRFV
uniref:Hydrolase_4 domain-containing protein n=1 Tax=Caenorhabditis japonica TaxID=281687 RepID=A0A8R1IUE7_CAEJA